MAPEYAMGQDVVPGSDLYSLGAVGYEMLCGQPPFDAPDYSSVIVMHVKEEPEPLARRNPSVPRALSDAIMRCLAKKPEERFVNAYELQEELERIYRDLDGERRSKTPSAPEEVPLSGETPHVAPAAVGIDVIKSYVQNARSDATSEYPAPVDEQVAKLLSSLEKLDAAIATTERKVEEHRNRVQATRDRFARAYATLEAEHGRIVGEVNSVEADLAVTTSQRSNVEHKFLEMRRRVRRAELDTGLTGPGLAMVDEALASLYEETASAACRWKEAHAAEQDCKEKLEERRGELRDLKFQLGQLESNRDAAIAKLEGTARGLSMVLKEQQSERKGLYDVFVAKTGSFQS